MANSQCATKMWRIKKITIGWASKQEWYSDNQRENIKQQFFQKLLADTRSSLGSETTGKWPYIYYI